MPPPQLSPSPKRCRRFYTISEGLPVRNQSTKRKPVFCEVFGVEYNAGLMRRVRGRTNCARWLALRSDVRVGGNVCECQGACASAIETAVRQGLEVGPEHIGQQDAERVHR